MGSAASTRQLVMLAGAAALPVTWLVLHATHAVEDPVPVAVFSGVAIFGASFLLSWASEVAQLDIPQALALVALALVAVLPEYAVDVYFAWRAGQDVTYTAYATANMTGGNRLLLGVGWATPALVLWARTGHREIRLQREQAIEVRYLALATLYSFVIPLKGTLSLFDTAILFVLFGLYLRAAARTPHHEPEIVGPAELLAGLRPAGRRLAVVALFALAGVAILSAAEPFAESLVAVGRRFGIEEFLLVQWIAPLASESPEFIVAVLFTLRGAAAAGMATMISSKVNQWTLLVGALPLAFSLSSGAPHAMHLDGRQVEEIFLTSAQSLFGLVVISNFTFSVVEAMLLFVLFAAQLVFTSPEARWLYAGLYIGLAVGVLALSRDVRGNVGQLLALPSPRRRR